jgi:hypothetical protein
LGLHDITKEARRAAWLLMLGIDVEGPEMAAHREIYSMFLSEKALAKTRQAEIETTIMKDVPRTFS